MSSESDMPLSQSIIELKPDDFILKPFTGKELELRVRRILTKKLQLRPVFEAIDQEDFKSALKQLDKLIATNERPRWTAYLLKLKGELLQADNNWSSGEVFFRKVITIKPYSWANIGLVNCLLHLNKFDEAEERLKSLVTLPECRLAALDILSQICKNNQNFEQAIKYLKSAAEMAPRNVERQQQVASFARVTHDFETQYQASNKIVEKLQHSVHHTPDAYLSAARATIDYGLTAFNDNEINALADLGDSILKQLKRQFPDIPLDDQIKVAKARIFNMNNNKESAKQLLQDNMNDVNHYLVDNLEDALDKAKAFHEMGFHKESEKLFDIIAETCQEQQCDDVFNHYIKQERKLRIEIKDSPKTLNNKAVKLYTGGNFRAALKAFLSAFKVMPKNPSIALNLLQTVVEGRFFETDEIEAKNIIARCKEVLDDATLSDEQTARLEVYLAKLATEDSGDQSHGTDGTDGTATSN